MLGTPCRRRFATGPTPAADCLCAERCGSAHQFHARLRTAEWRRAPRDAQFFRELAPSSCEHYGAGRRCSQTNAACARTRRRRFAILPQGVSPALLLTRLLREDLREAAPDAPPPRALVFSADDAAAEALATPLRGALWQEHRIGLVLPSGQQPTRMLEVRSWRRPVSSQVTDTAGHSRARIVLGRSRRPPRGAAAKCARWLQDFAANATSVLLVTAAHARGLDLPAVTHVYSLGPPASAADYVHRTGRVGRVGHTAAGTMTSVVTQTELPALRAAAAAAGVALAELDAHAALAGAASGDGSIDGDGPALDDVKRNLEDVFYLQNTSQDDA